MSEGVASTQAGFIDRSRFRANFDEPDYTRRIVERPKPRTAQDINSPAYNSKPVTEKVNARAIALGRKLSESILSALLEHNQSEQPLTTQEFQEPETRNRPKVFNVFNHLFSKRSKMRLATTVLAFLVIVAGAYLGVVGYKNNQTVKIQATKLTAEANKAAVTGTGSTSTSNAISTIKPTPKAVAAYAVAPDYPKYLKIPSIGVDAEVGQTGLLASGALGTPSNVYYTDWYTGSAEPGQPGATLIDGHVSSWTADGVFFNLHKLTAGDSIQIVKGDNSVVNYVVVSTQVYSSGNVNMQAAITPVVPGVSGLNLITCTGDVIKGTSLFNERIIVFAKEVS